MNSDVILFIRDSYDAKVLANYLHRKKVNINKIILETGKIAKKKKLERIKRDEKHSTIFKFLWLAFLVIYTKYYYTRMKSKIKKHPDFSFNHKQYPPVPIIKVDDINQLDPSFVELDKEIIIVSGTAILKQETIDSFGKGMLYNIHTGILPFYRNVHSDFWSLYNNDIENMGVTLFRINAGIDTGDIIDIRKIPKHGVTSLSNIKAENLMLSCKMALDITNKNSNDIVEIQQEITTGKCYPTPNHLNFWRLLKLRGFKKTLL